MEREEFFQEILDQIRQNVDVFRKEAPIAKIELVESIGSCPVCGRTMKESSKSWYCSGYREDPKCSFTIWKQICNKGISEANARELIIKKKSGLIKGFKSIQGKEFSAYLILKDDYTVGFAFPQRKKKGR